MVYAEDYGEEAYVEVNQGIEAVSEDEQQNAVVTDETSQTTTDGEGGESDTDLAKARESETGEAASWKDKLKEGSYLNYFGHVQTYGDLTYVSDDGRSPNGDVSFNGYPGMNCTGFVWYVLQSVGASGNTVPNMQGASWCAGGWVSWQRIHASQIPTYDFSNKWEMLESGVLEKGDIIWIWNENEGGKSGLSGTHHIGFFWGDTSDEDFFWHSSPYGGNQISPINGLSDNVSYTVMKL